MSKAYHDTHRPGPTEYVSGGILAAGAFGVLVGAVEFTRALMYQGSEALAGVEAGAGLGLMVVGGIGLAVAHKQSTH